MDRRAHVQLTRRVNDAEHSPCFVVAENLRVSAPGNHREQCLFRVALAQMIFKFRLESDSRSRLTLSFLQNVPDVRGGGKLSSSDQKTR